MEDDFDENDYNEECAKVFLIQMILFYYQLFEKSEELGEKEINNQKDTEDYKNLLKKFNIYMKIIDRNIQRNICLLSIEEQIAAQDIINDENHLRVLVEETLSYDDTDDSIRIIDIIIRMIKEKMTSNHGYYNYSEYSNYLSENSDILVSTHDIGIFIRPDEVSKSRIKRNLDKNAVIRLFQLIEEEILVTKSKEERDKLIGLKYNLVLTNLDDSLLEIKEDIPLNEKEVDMDLYAQARQEWINLIYNQILKKLLDTSELKEDDNIVYNRTLASMELTACLSFLDQTELDMMRASFDEEIKRRYANGNNNMLLMSYILDECIEKSKTGRNK